ncbi:MAG TPA: tetratricopeptide repeat protein [Verrucomicrobiae bacterium]|nr:tetratricopeptide repeat protein [Verrucomicrobiae bacterium]
MLLGDAASYDAWARQIANGDWLGKNVFYQAPLYPYFLGGLYILWGRNLLAVRLVQIVIGAGSCVLLARAGRSFFSQNAGLLAGVVLAACPTAIFFDCSIQKSVLDLFFVCGLLAVLGRLLERPQRRWWLGTGVVLGLLALTRENGLIFLPILLAWLFVLWRRELWTTRLQWAGLLLLGLAVVLLPVGCRNLLVGGEFHLTTAQFGPNFYIGNGRDATGGYHPLVAGHGSAEFERDDATRLAERAMGRRLSPGEVSRYWTARALVEVRENSARWLRLMVKKCLLVWNVSEVCDSEDQYTYGDWSPLLRTLNHLLHFGTICPLALLGVCLTWSQRRRLWVLYAMILGYAASVVIFYVFSRYRFPVVPLLVLLAAAGVTGLRGAVHEKRWKALWTGVTTAAMAAVMCNRAMVPETHIRATTHYNIALDLEEHGKPELAVVHYAETVRLVPEFAPAHVQLGGILVREGRVMEGIGYLEQALRIKPDYAEAHYNLGVALAQTGRIEDAIGHYEQALRIDPDYAEAHNDLGVVLAQTGRIDDAIGHYEQALRIDPDYAKAHNNLGVALVQVGRVQEAIGHYEQALRIDPDYARAHNNLGNALVQVGRVQEAIGHYERAVQLKPDFTAAQRALARLRGLQRRD